jgi:hypothetical protein
VYDFGSTGFNPRSGPYNWKRGQKDFFLDAWNHAFVHLQKFKEG